jgi:hypothetical protein
MLWGKDSEEAAALPLNPEWPVAVITAGDENRADPRRAPAEASRAGYYENAPLAQHATLLGARHNEAVVHGVDHVLAALTRPLR